MLDGRGRKMGVDVNPLRPVVEPQGLRTGEGRARKVGQTKGQCFRGLGAKKASFWAKHMNLLLFGFSCVSDFWSWVTLS